MLASVLLDGTVMIVKSIKDMVIAAEELRSA
jgi:hypothetical protein